MRTPVLFGLLVVLGISMMAACKHEAPVNPAPDTTPVDTGVCFERDILPIFVASCAQSGCHDASSKQEGYQLTDYVSIMKKGIKAGNAAGSKIYEEIVRKRMPQPPVPALTTQQTELIRRWIDQGAPNTVNCVAPCDSNNYKYSTGVKPLLEKYCTGCHYTGAPTGLFELDNYEGVKSAALSGELLGAIKHQVGYSPMPQGGQQLSDCQIKQVQKWIADGVPNN